MKEYYAGMDVHCEVVMCEVHDNKGNICSQNRLVTEVDTLISFVKAIPGRVHLAFEEGNLAAWLHDSLKPHVYRLVVCDPRKMRQEINKNDRIDAHRLAQMLRAGQLTPVYHGDQGTRPLKEAARAYRYITQDSTRVKNRLKDLFRSRGINVAGDSIYSLEKKGEWLSKLDFRYFRKHAESHYRHLEVLNELRKRAKRSMLTEAGKLEACRLLADLPGIGPIRSAFIVSEVITPHRFRTKRRYWNYCGLAVVVRSSSDYEVRDGVIRRKKRHGTTRGLNRYFNGILKDVYKGAAIDAIKGDMKPFYQRRVDEGMRPEMARLTLARKLAAMSLAIWKTGEPYDIERALMRTDE